MGACYELCDSKTTSPNSLRNTYLQIWCTFRRHIYFIVCCKLKTKRVGILSTLFFIFEINYKTMFNKTTLLSCATSLVGFRQDSNAIYSGLSAALKASTSGLYVNDLSGVNYEIIGANLSQDNTANQYLTDVVSSETISIVNKFINRSKSNLNAKELLSNQSIVSGVASFNNKVTQNQRFVGYWFRPFQSNNLKIQITKLGMQTDTIQANIKIYLYITSQLAPLKTFTFNASTASSLVWQDVTDWVMNYESETGGTGQSYLLGYYEKDLSNPQAEQLQGRALYMDFDCGCSNSPSKLYSKYMSIFPIEISNQNLNWNSNTSTYDIPLVDNIGDFISTQTYGLTAKINVTCDITRVLCQNIQLFAQALQYGMASRILYDAYASNRINSISDSKREQCKQFAVKYDGILNGYTTPEGIKVKGLIDTTTIDFSELDRFCLPCQNTFIKTQYLRR